MIDREAVAAVREITRILMDRAPLSKAERHRLYEPYSRRAFRTMLDSGVSYGEATGAPGTAIGSCGQGDFKEHIRSIDNALAEQARIVREGIDHYFANGEIPAPYYAWRIAIILRKAKEYEAEADFLEAFSRHFRHGVGARYKAIAERATKARQLARKKGVG